jgi:glycosyltransferase involved in cell wall biosynthesis
MKRYGIFIAYSPNTDLRTEGLGRYLTAFLKAATARGDSHFSILCPSWSRDALIELCTEAGIPVPAYSLLGPSRTPVLYRLYKLLQRTKLPKQKRRPFRALLGRLYPTAVAHAEWLKERIAGARSFTTFIGFLAYGVLLALPTAAIVFAIRLTRKVATSAYRGFKQALKRIWQGLNALPVASPSDIRFRLYEGMLARETALMIEIGNAERDIGAWYTPAAFWPNVNELRAPVLTCVPDVVLTEFPAGFSAIGGDPMFHSYQTVASTIRGSRDFVTYSEHIKRDTLVHMFGIDPAAVRVIRHAPNDLSGPMTVTGFPDNEATSCAYAQSLLLGAIRKASYTNYASTFSNSKVKFLFYASQFRPSKNVMTLLRAYEWLLRKRHIGHKLILTGSGDYESVKAFLDERNLRADVLCVHGLTEPELAACYKLADLAVNPSLSEGGMPFTFTEALSLGTPVVMGDIEVTREIITDPALRATTLFDPYDWRAMADKIEWALNNRGSLCTQQRKFYDDVLSRRSWDDVVAEHIAILNEIAVRDQQPVPA